MPCEHLSFNSAIIKACLAEMEVEKARRCTITVLQTYVSGKKRLKSNNYDIYHFIPNVWIRPAPVIACGREPLINKRTTLEIPKAMCDSHGDTSLISIMGYLSTDVPQILVPVDFFAYDNRTWGWYNYIVFQQNSHVDRCMSNGKLLYWNNVSEIQ